MPEDEAYDKIEKRPENGCRYIIGELTDENWDYCGALRRRNPDGSLHRMRYCDRHFEICVQPAYVPKRRSGSEKYRLIDQEAA
jgi:hypothetical protein